MYTVSGPSVCCHMSQLYHTNICNLYVCRYMYTVKFIIIIIIIVVIVIKLRIT